MRTFIRMLDLALSPVRSFAEFARKLRHPRGRWLLASCCWLAVPSGCVPRLPPGVGRGASISVFRFWSSGSGLSAALRASVDCGPAPLWLYRHVAMWEESTAHTEHEPTSQQLEHRTQTQRVAIRQNELQQAIKKSRGKANCSNLQSPTGPCPMSIRRMHSSECAAHLLRIPRNLRPPEKSSNQGVRVPNTAAALKPEATANDSRLPLD